MRKTVVLAVLLGGCTTVSDVALTGNNSYLVISQGAIGNGSGAAQKIAALQAANSYCDARGAKMEQVRAEQTEPFFGRAPSAQVEFRCAPK